MGDPRRQRRKYETPKHPWRQDQIEVELKLMGEYGLRNKKELWRYKSLISKIRGIARSLLAGRSEERERIEQAFLGRLKRTSLISETGTIDEVLDLDIRDLLERRLQTTIFRSGLAASASQARQLISHGHIAVGDRVVYVPGYLVSRGEESKIKYFGGSLLSKRDHPLRKALTTTRTRPTEATVEKPPEVSAGGPQPPQA